MPKSTNILLLAFISFNSFAQKPGLEKLGLKSLQQKLSYIPSKSFRSLVHTGSDSVSTYGSRISTVQGFYISQTEVTNKEYREFVRLVRDSIAHTLLRHFSNENAIDWNQKIDWNDSRLEPLMIPSGELFTGGPEINAGKIIFELDFFGQKETISIYPDTLVWIRDFSYSYNEPMVKRYFAHSAYDNYPVVGISQKQAMAFCQWKTGQFRQSMKGKDAADIDLIVRLPNYAEWESAAFEEKDSDILFAGNKGYNCNFGTITTMSGVMKKGYKDDGYFYTSPVKKYPAGPFGIYDMKGNVAEWTLTTLEEIMNAEMKPGKEKKSFVVKGGGWNSTPFYLQAGACQFFDADAAHSFVGFRYMVVIKNK